MTQETAKNVSETLNRCNLDLFQKRKSKHHSRAAFVSTPCQEMMNLSNMFFGEFRIFPQFEFLRPRLHFTSFLDPPVHLFFLYGNWKCRR